MAQTTIIPEELLKRIQAIVNGLPLIILGSGASVNYNIPSMWQLGEYLKDNIKLIQKDDLVQFEAFKQSLDDTKDLEKALSTLALNENVLNAIIENTWKCINTADLQAYEEFIIENKPFPLSQLIGHLVSTTKKQISIVTTNYDRLIEYASSFANALICNGFAQNYHGNFSSDLENNNSLGYSGRVKIWKVHGSLDWFRTKDGENIQLPLRHTIPTSFTPSIVTPGLSKYAETHKEPYRTILTKADHEIKNSNAYLCIGYGFNDEHVQPLLIQGIKAGKPIIVLTKKITEKARQAIIENGCKHYILLEEYNNSTKVYSSEFGDQIIDKLSLWDLSTLITYIK
ncbi:SIR2 family protein [uncultured Alistipes sp.]|uniref:SIR2 family protein n=1 Tax=uncultured Alistipes sp. TaxID=538949 RepID=UPI002586C5FD|nr:SIR2 family protein [uncultured Alistipes sp.]